MIIEKRPCQPCDGTGKLMLVIIGLGRQTIGDDPVVCSDCGGTGTINITWMTEAELLAERRPKRKKGARA